MEIHNRKITRLKDYDYSKPGAYFITICTQNRKCLLWENVGAITNRLHPSLSDTGKIVEQCILNISKHYPMISVDHYVVMPNHVHLLLRIDTDPEGRLIIAPTISTVVRLMKRAATRQIGGPIWQRGFHDHIIRGEQDYLKIWEYIENNPVKWLEDCFYNEQAGD